MLLIFMQKMELLLQKTPPEDVKSDVLPMVYRALETETASPQIQELCLVRVPDFASLVDYPAMKNALVILRPSPKNFFLLFISFRCFCRLELSLTLKDFQENVRSLP